MLRTCTSLPLASISAWKIVTDCLANLSISVSARESGDEARRRRFQHVCRLQSSPDEKQCAKGLCCTLSKHRTIVQLTL